ncbi:MAG TPA: histidine kinase [Rhodoferax sp.]|jgi:sensor histidine kinase YesM|nr:histidine kinase [Rhodoferax sp.]HPW28316.1 histidine kinase [Rhodoferax sp.]
MKIDWLAKLRSGLQTTAFCLAIAGMHFAFRPDIAYENALVYSLCIGLTTWLLIDFGAELSPTSRATGWPTGLWGKLLPVVGIAAGYAIGVTLADSWFGWSSWAGASRRQLFLSALVSAVIGTVVTYYFYSRGRSAHLEQKVNEATRLATEARLKLLEAQLEPHMLFNTLANLRMLIGLDSTRAQAMLDHIIAYLRATLSASRTSSHPLQREFDRLHDYLELMTVRMGPRLRYTLDLPAELAQHPVPTLLLQPLVENSIQHGLEPKVEGGTLTISAHRAGDTMVLEVVDTGLGFDPTDPAFTHPASIDKGFGVQQIRERLAAVYGTKGTIEFIATHASGTRATIRFPYQP